MACPTTRTPRSSNSDESCYQLSLPRRRAIPSQIRIFQIGISESEKVAGEDRWNLAARLEIGSPDSASRDLRRDALRVALAQPSRGATSRRAVDATGFAVAHGPRRAR